MDDEFSFQWNLKAMIWAVSAGTIAAFFFATTFLEDVTSFNPGGSFMLISPIMCGLLLGIVTWEADAIKTVIMTFVLTTTATLGVIMALTSPVWMGVAWVPDQYYIFVAQNSMITIILVLPLSMLGSMVGRIFAENTIMSTEYKYERDQLRNDTEEWYRMLEEKLEEKKAALDKVQKKESETEE